jgi:hypothetical protein
MTQWGLDTLFNPAKRHMDEEKRRLQSTREQLGDSSGGKRIDLESGKVTIRRSTRPAEDDETEDEDEEQAAKDEAAENKPAKDAAAKNPAAKNAAAKDQAVKDQAAKDAAAKDAAKPQKPPPSPAAIRAAQRRGRQPR